jgi:hypothetical protein
MSSKSLCCRNNTRRKSSKNFELSSLRPNFASEIRNNNKKITFFPCLPFVEQAGKNAFQKKGSTFHGYAGTPVNKGLAGVEGGSQRSTNVSQCFHKLIGTHGCRSCARNRLIREKVVQLFIKWYDFFEY